MRALRLSRWTTALCLVAAVLCPRAGAAQDARPLPSTAVIAARATPATVTIIAVGASGDTLGQGSGFFIRPTGVLVTNWHVMRGAARAVVVRDNGERFDRVTFVDGDSAADIAILKVPGYALPVLDPRADVPAVGERVVAIGSPRGLSHTVTEGIVSARRVVGGRELVQMSAPISPGSSGGAVLDEQGQVFAVSTAYLEGGQQLNFAVPIRYALGLLPPTISERPLASVFGEASTPAGRSAPSASASVARGPGRATAPTLPAPTRKPRATLDGTYSVSQTWFRDPDGAGARQIGQQVGLLIAKNRVGLLILAFEREDSTLSPTVISVLERWRATPDGQVAMALTDVEYGGHQTRDGFALASHVEIGSNQYDLQLEAEPYRLPISRNTGLYAATARTFYYSADGEREPTSTTWRGDLAAGFTSDTVHVDLFLYNSAGGSTGLYGSSPLGENGSFRIENDGHVLEGSVRAGVLRAGWLDRRSGGSRFQGTLEAVRQ